MWVLQNDLAAAVKENGRSGAPADFELFQNFPNPFNGTTTMTFFVGKKGMVSLEVHDMLGRRVGLVVEGPENEGKHQIAFDASKLASGVYFYRLRSGSLDVTRKMIILR